MVRPHDKQKIHFVCEGILDAVVEEPETQDAFKAWDKKLRRRKPGSWREIEQAVFSRDTAYHLIRNDLGCRLLTLPDREVADGPSLWKDPHGYVLAAMLQSRYITYAATRSGLLVEDRRRDFFPTVAEASRYRVQEGDLTIKISPYWPVWYAKKYLRSLRAN